MTDSQPPIQTEASLSDEEFMRRLRERFIERAGPGADAVADSESVDRWRAYPYEDYPEDAADEEMSNWEDDGE